MAELQQTLIYVEKENIEEAEFMSRSFVTREVKTRAYLNALGAELILKYLKSEGIDTENLHNLHSISKVLEKYDISDILLPNIHIDVRVVFDKNQLFIPKSHFENEITPDIYTFLIISDDFKTAEFLGYCETSAIDKRKANSDYYFVDLEQLISADTLVKFIKNFVGKNKHSITEEEMLKGRQLSISMADHNTTKFEEKELIELLLQSDELRESVLEFDNFETLAYSAAPEVSKVVNNETEIISAPSETDSIDIVEEDTEISDDEIVDGEETEITDNNENATENKDEIAIDNSFTDNLETSDIEEKEDLFGDSMLEDNITLEEEPTAEIESSPEKAVDIEIEPEFKNETAPAPIAEPVVEPELSVNENTVTIESTSTLEAENLSVDAILDQTIASIDTKSLGEDRQPKPENNNKDSNIADKIITTAAQTGAAAVAGIAGAATAETAAKIAAAETVSDGAMKLAGVSGELINNVLSDNIKKQSENLDKIDSELIGTDPKAIEESANAEAIERLSTSKQEENTENEKIKEYAPKDISQLEKVDTIASTTKEQRFVHETIDMSQMETVENDIYIEEHDSGVDIDTIKDFEAVKKKEEELTQTQILSESEVVEIPDSVKYAINDDGTSTFDDIMLDKNMPPVEDTEHLIDISTGNDNNIIKNTNIDEISKQADENEINDETIENMVTQELIAESQEILKEPAIDNNITDTLENIELDDDIDLDIIDSKIDALMEDELANASTQADIIPTETENVQNEEILAKEANLEEQITEDSAEEISIDDFPAELFDDENQEILSEETDNNEKEPIAEDETSVETTDNEELSIEDFEQIIDENNDNSEVQKDNASIDDFLELTDDTQEVSLEDQDWLNDMPAEVIDDAEEISTEDIVEEPEAPITKETNVVENSTIISDKTFKAGEIPIDINNSVPIELGDSESLGKLYNQNSSLPGEALLNNPGRMSAQKGISKSPISAIMGFVGLLITLAIVGAVGFGIAKMFKAPKEEAPQPITDDAASLNIDAIKTDNEKALDVNPNNVVSMDNNTNALASTAGTGQSAVTAARTTGTATAFVEIKKLSWEIPDYISQNANFKQYFQSAGKSLKNALTADLLLATDYIYSSPVKLSVTFDKEGTFKNSQIITSSGSTQIDSIVLQTVNQTFKALKAPNSVGNDQSTTAILKIYF